VLKVWGRKNSSNVQKVMWAIGELDLPHQRVDLGMEFGGNKTAAYLALNPNGLVPTLEDDAFVLWESNTILRYLAATYGAGTLEPADRQVRARASQWLDWQISAFLPAFNATFMQLVRTLQENRDADALEQSKIASIAAAKILDQNLERHPFTAGDQFSMADIALGVFIHRFRILIPARPLMPNLERWFAATEIRPGFQEHVGSIPLT
jgi:glutathione S-transferase